MHVNKGLIRMLKKPELVKINMDHKKHFDQVRLLNSTLDNYKRSDNLMEGAHFKRASLNPK
jgi:hypothetical protein